MLPYQQTSSPELSRLQTTWASQLNPLLVIALNQGAVIKDIALTTGSNTINHLLGRSLQGWFIVRQRSAASVYDTQDLNQTPTLTLLLTSSADVSVDLFVF